MRRLFAREHLLVFGKTHSTCLVHIIKNNLTSSLGRVFKVGLPARLHYLYTDTIYIYIYIIFISDMYVHIYRQTFKKILHLYTTQLLTELTSHFTYSGSS